MSEEISNSQTVFSFFNSPQTMSFESPAITLNDLIPLLNDIKEIKETLTKYAISQSLKETQLPSEIIEPIIQNNLLPKKRLGRPLLEGEVRDTLSRFKTMKLASDYLGVSSGTLKNYCKLYDKSLWKPERGPTTKGKNDNK